jgi:hypothetical protein
MQTTFLIPVISSNICGQINAQTKPLIRQDLLRRRLDADRPRPLNGNVRRYD